MATPELDISVLASTFQQPIADLTVKLIAMPYVKPDRVGANFYECGYAASAIILVTAMIESMIQRDRYFLRAKTPNSNPKEVPHHYLKTDLKYRRCSRVQELFELRNSLAHNHIWEIEYTWPTVGGRQHKRSTLIPKTHRLSAPPKPNARVPRTKIVRFNILPLRVDRTDLTKALIVATDLFEFMAAKGRVPINIASNTVVLPRSRPSFSTLAEVIRNAA